MKALITGINGFIGHFLIKVLSQRKIMIEGVVRPGARDPNMQKSLYPGVIYESDVTDAAGMLRVLKSSKPDMIVHLAAQPHVSISWAEPIKTIEANVIGTVALFEAIRESKLNPMVVVASSSAVYGQGSVYGRMMHEDDPFQPLSPQAVSKAAQDFLCYQYFSNYQIRVVRARIFGATGPRKRGDACSDFARQIARIEANLADPIIRVGNLAPRRDLTDVRDIAKGLQALSCRGKVGDVYNLCTGRAPTMQEVPGMMLKQATKSIHIVEDPSKIRLADENIIVGDNNKVKHECGWEPKIPLNQTLGDTLAYWRNIS